MEIRHALAAWVRAKQSLERIMRREDYQSFVRPMYLIAVLSRCHLLLAAPPNKRIFERARNFRHNLVAAIEPQNYHLAGVTAYPSDEELVILQNFPSFAPFVDLIWRKRVEKIEARKKAEDSRDAADLSRYLHRQDSDSLASVAACSRYRVMHSERLAPIAEEILVERRTQDARMLEARL